MRFTGRVPLGMLATLLLFTLVSAAAVEEAMTKRVDFATLERTVMTMNFNEAAVSEAIASLEFSQDIHNSYGALLAITGTGTPTAQITSVELGQPLRGISLDDNELPATTAEMIHVGVPAIFHDLRIVPVNVTPVMLDEQGIARVVRSVEFEVETRGGGGVNTKTLNTESFSPAFDPIYRTMIDNLDELHPNRSLRKPGRMLVLGPSNLMSQLQSTDPYRDWLELKRRKGYQVEVRTLADVQALTGDSTANSIRDFVSLTYHQAWLPDLEFAVLLGDVNGVYAIPSYFMQNPEFPGNPNEVSVGDNFFFAVDGADYVADVFHSRISGQSLLPYIAYFSKVLLYERSPYRSDTDWFESATFVAGNYSDGSGTFPVTPVWNTNWAREIVMNEGMISDADTFYIHDLSEPPGLWTEAIGNDLEDGVCAVFYRGWASQQLWQYPRFGNDQIEALNLGQRNPAVFGIVCGSGDFEAASGECMAEKWTTGVGGVGEFNVNGAIMYFGASDLHTNTRHNNAMLAGITRALQNGIRSTGALAMAGKLEVLKQFPLELDGGGLVNFYGFHVFNLLGDPETQIYFGQPHSFDVDYPAELTPGDNLVALTVRDATSNPVAGAAVTLRDGFSQDIACAMTDETGQVLLPADLTAGNDAQIVVWKSEYFQEWIDLPIQSTEFDPYIASVEWNAEGGGLPNPGETANFDLMIVNRGTVATTPSITVSSDDERITVTSGSAAGSEIQPGAEATVGPFTIQLVDGPLPDGTEVALNVQISDGGSVDRQIFVAVSAPDPQIWDIIVNDADGVLSPGETVDVSVALVNRGSFASAVSATVSSHDNGISISNGDLSWANLPVGEIVESSNSFTATVPGDAMPGRQIVLRFSFEMNGVHFTHKLKIISAGVIDIDVPTGPDQYGYYAYEDIDTGYDATPVYEWVELNPDSGGSGATLHEVRDDTYFGIPLPTPFQFYGQTYDSVWICSNGWLSFGRATIPEFRNWEIPSPIGPPAMLCPFWDDLISSEDSVNNNNSPHSIFTRDDGNRFIVMWQTLNRRGIEGATPENPSTDFCTFEVILEYDGGDGSILCQYKQVSNIDTKQNYATIGIQNADHTDGLGLTYADIYPASVDTIRAGRAIRFTTDAPDNYLGAENPGQAGTVPLEFALHPAFPNPFNPSTELRFDLTQSGPVTLKVYDVLGRETATLLDRTMTAGSHAVQFTANGLPSGLYFARLSSGSDVAIQKLMLVK